MYIVFLTLLVVWTVFMCLYENFFMRKSPNSEMDEEKAEFIGFLYDLAFLWGPAVAVLIMAFIGNISFADLGFRWISFDYDNWITMVILVLCGLALLYFLRPFVAFLRKNREKKPTDSTTEQSPQEIALEKREKKQFALLNFSSAICEELVFRGFLAFLLQAIFHNIPFLVVILVAGLLFGFAHIYQGLEGIIETAIFGIMQMSLLLVTGSLILPLVLHFIINYGDFLEEGEEDFD
ncbi:MAG: CPBP family intramembrane metalloprotease [Firmicutes bacterium]|nr:CPBP family intramembrane metalloprotease [Bacillota bacterium]